MRKNSLVRIDTEEMQGEGTFVTMRRPRWKAMRQAMQGMGIEQTPGNEAELGLALMDVLIPGMIVAWNWTDEDGQPLPLPSDDAAVWDDMPPNEALFLIQKGTPLIALERKN